MSISSRELNYLVWRYLQESGFQLTAYALMNDTPIKEVEESLAKVVAHGSLVDLVQRGLQFLELESKVKELNVTKESPYTLLKALTVEKEINKEQRQLQLELLQHEKEVAGVEADVSTTASSSSAKLSKSKDESPVTATNTEMEIDTTLLSVVCTGDYEEAAQFNPADSSLVAVGNDSSSDIWHLQDGNIKSTSLLSKDSLEKDKYTTSIRWNNTGRLVAQGTFEGKVRVWTMEGKLRLMLDIHTAPVMVLRWNPTDTLLLSLDCNNNAIVWDVFSGDVVRSIKTDSQVGNGGGVSSNVTVGNDAIWIDSSTFAVTSDTASLAVYKVTGTSLSTNEPLLRFRGHGQGINCLDFDDTTQLLCSSSDDHTVRIWYGKNSLPVSVLSGHRGPVVASKWITKPKTLEGIVKLTHIATGPVLVSASMDGTARLWDPASGKCMTNLDLPGSTGPTVSPLFCLEISSNGKYLAAGGYNGIIYVWDIESLYTESSFDDSLQKFRKPIAMYKAPAPTAEAESEDAEDKKDSAVTINSISWSSDSKSLLALFSHQTVVFQLN